MSLTLQEVIVLKKLQWAVVCFWDLCRWHLFLLSYTDRGATRISLHVSVNLNPLH